MHWTRDGEYAAERQEEVRKTIEKVCTCSEDGICCGDPQTEQPKVEEQAFYFEA